MKLFDRLEKLIHTGAVAKVMGTPAVWASADGEVTYSGTVFFNDPTARESFDRTEFTEVSAFMEFWVGAFPGLMERVLNGGTGEVVSIDGVDYSVTAFDRLYDGNTHKAYLLIV